MNNYGKLKKIEALCKDAKTRYCSDSALHSQFTVNPIEVKAILDGILKVIQNE